MGSVVDRVAHTHHGKSGPELERALYEQLGGTRGRVILAKTHDKRSTTMWINKVAITEALYDELTSGEATTEDDLDGIIVFFAKSEHCKDPVVCTCPFKSKDGQCWVARVWGPSNQYRGRKDLMPDKIVTLKEYNERRKPNGG